MVNALMISNNIHFVEKLLDEFNSKDLNLKLVGVVTTANLSKAVNELNTHIIFLDKSIIKNCDKLFLEKYQNILIKLSYKPTSKLINNNNLDKINTLIENNDFEKKKSKIVKELEYIGYKFNYKGTHYLVDTIMLMHMHQHSMIDNLQTHIYPIIAQKYNKTVYNIKSSINKATECMYYECDVNKLENYFKFNYDTKPTVKQVVFAVINKI